MPARPKSAIPTEVLPDRFSCTTQAGIACTAQRVPFQCSALPAIVPALKNQASRSELAPNPAELTAYLASRAGTGTIRQAVPFQRSTRKVLVSFDPPHGEQTSHVDQASARPVAIRFTTLVTPWSGPTVVGTRHPEPAPAGSVAAEAAPSWIAAPAMTQALVAAMASTLTIPRLDMGHLPKSKPFRAAKATWIEDVPQGSKRSHPITGPCFITIN